jgi:hypothetical protein
MKVTLYMDVYPGKTELFCAYSDRMSSVHEGFSRVKFTVDIPENILDLGEVKAERE